MAIRMVSLLDGTLVDPAQPIVRADDQGVGRGDGVFEALLAVNGRGFQVEEHLARLAESAQILQLPTPDAAGYRRAIDAILAVWDWDAEPEAILRFIMTRGAEGIDEPNGWVMAAPPGPKMLQERRDGVRVLLLNRGTEGSEIAGMPWLLPGAKSLSYAVNMAARRHAAANDADDIIFVTPSGVLLEGPTSSVVLDLDGVLTTPPPEGILRSITIAEMLRKAPSAGLTARTGRVTVEDLARARGAWLLSSGRIIARITAADGKRVPTSPLDDGLRRLLDVPGA